MKKITNERLQKVLQSKEIQSVNDMMTAFDKLRASIAPKEHDPDCTPEQYAPGEKLRAIFRQGIEGRIQLETTFDELLNTYGSLAIESLMHAGRRIVTSEKRRNAGQRGKGAPRLQGHDWKAICHDYDRLISEGKKRATVTNVLSKRHNIRKDVLARGLRQRERGIKTIKDR